jgi:hypothetical protein
MPPTARAPAPTIIPTEPLGGSIPRPIDLIERVARRDTDDPALVPLYDRVQLQQLSISRSIAEEHGGRLWAAPTNDGPSTTVHFTV